MIAMLDSASKRPPRLPAGRFAARISLTFRPQIALINSTREYVAGLYTDITRNADLPSRIALTAHELLENVFKYSTDGVAVVDIRVVRGARGDTVRLTIRNRSEANRIADLRQRIGQLQASDSPHALYYSLLDSIVPDSEVSGLGLARICAEGEMKLAYEIKGDEVTVIAEAPMEVRSAA
jgi:hypothetical protein